MSDSRSFLGSRAALLAIFLVGLFAASLCAAQQETVLHNFGGGTDGQVPYSAFAIDGNGNLFGTTNLGGIHSKGTVVELSPRQGGGYLRRDHDQVR